MVTLCLPHDEPDIYFQPIAQAQVVYVYAILLLTFESLLVALLWPKGRKRKKNNKNSRSNTMPKWSFLG